MEALGRVFDVSCGFTPVDLATAGATGKRIAMRHYAAIDLVIFVGAAASGTEAVTFTLQEHNASSSGTSQNLACIDQFYTKYEATLDGDETWTLVTQTAAATIAIAAGDRDKEGIIVCTVDEESLSDGFNYISLSVADPGSVSRLGAVLYFPHDLKVQRKAANLVAPLS